MEAYGRLDVDPELAHATDWQAASTGVDGVCELRLPAAELAERYDRWLAVADREPADALATGSGWGALELARTWYEVSAGTPFTEVTMTDRERAWLQLLKGSLPATDPVEPPDGTLVAWRDLLEKADDNWLVWYHRGVARWYAGDEGGAVDAWRSSVAAGESPWAWRNLAFAARADGRTDDAVDAYRRAVELAPAVRPLAIEALDVLVAADRHDDAAAVLDRLPAAVRADGRVLFAEARIRLARGDASGARTLLAEGIELPGLREGANQLAELWADVQAALGTSEPVPAAYDFSMSGTD